MRPTSITGTSTTNAILASGVNFVQFTSGVNFVQLASGTNFVTISGATFSVSGNIVNTSGQVAAISGQVTNISGSIVTISGNAVITSVSGNVISTSISGNAVSVSGNTINTSVSGNIVNTSGQVAAISGQAVTVSGNIVNVSGQSFQPTYGSNTVIRPRNILSVTANSGGTTLASGDCSQITIRALSGNTGVVFIGATTGDQMPWGVSATSGKGLVLGPGDGVTFPISNMNLVNVAAQQASTSGDKVSYMGVQY